MNVRIYPILVLFVFGGLACLGEEEYPGPEGTVFPGHIAFPAAPTEQSGQPGNGGTQPSIMTGFRASINGTNLPGGSAGAISSGGFAPFVNLTASLDDADYNHTFSFTFQTRAGVYNLVPASQWVGNPADAGFQYARATTGSPAQGVSSLAGSLEITEYRTDRVLGFFNASGVVDGEDTEFVGDFNVQVVQQ